MTTTRIQHHHQQQHVCTHDTHHLTHARSHHLPSHFTHSHILTHAPVQSSATPSALHITTANCPVSISCSCSEVLGGTCSAVQPMRWGNWAVVVLGSPCGRTVRGMLPWLLCRPSPVGVGRGGGCVVVERGCDGGGCVCKMSTHYIIHYTLCTHTWFPPCPHTPHQPKHTISLPSTCMLAVVLQCRLKVRGPLVSSAGSLHAMSSGVSL